MKITTGIVVILTMFAMLVFGRPAPALADETLAATNGQPAAGEMLAQAKQGVEEVNDPLEPVNRAIFDFNEVVQDAFLRPITRFYNDTVPATVRLGISNFINNLSTPVTLANDILQGEGQRALETVGRAMVNSTFGILGFSDLAPVLVGTRDPRLGFLAPAVLERVKKLEAARVIQGYHAKLDARLLGLDVTAFIFASNR